MTANRVHDAHQLLRLRQLREEAARAEVERCREAQAERQRVVDARLAQIADARMARDTLLSWIGAVEAEVLPRLAPFAEARRALLDDQLERAEFELIDERTDLDRADAALATARAQWLRARGRSEAVATLHHDARRAHGLARERRDEAEIEGPSPIRSMTGGR